MLVAKWLVLRADASVRHPRRTSGERHLPHRMGILCKWMLAFFVAVKLGGSATWFYRITIRRSHVLRGCSYPILSNKKLTQKTAKNQRPVSEKSRRPGGNGAKRCDCSNCLATSQECCTALLDDKIIVVLIVSTACKRPQMWGNRRRADVSGLLPKKVVRSVCA